MFSLSFGCQKIGSPCASFGPCLRSSAVIVRCSPLQRKPKRLSQQNWVGRMRARWWWWWFSVLSLFFVFTSLRAVHSPSLGLAGVLELAMRLSYLRVVLSFSSFQSRAWSSQRGIAPASLAFERARFTVAGRASSGWKHVPRTSAPTNGHLVGALVIVRERYYCSD